MANDLMEHFHFDCNERYFEMQGQACAWVGGDGRPCEAIEDRLQGTYVVETRRGLVESESLAETGMQILSLKDAATLGFTTSEYQTGLRVQFLKARYLESEADLAVEMVPPNTFLEAVDRERATSRDYDWEVEDVEKRIPYPNEEWFAHEKAIGWATPDGRLMKGVPEDRFTCRWLSRDIATGEVRYCPHTIDEIGIESLSINDALKLGFSTTEYQTALRVRIFERRFLRSEHDLMDSISPPLEVQRGFNRWGRIFAESEERREARAFCDGYMFDWADAYEEPIRRWMDRSHDAIERASDFTLR